LILLEDIEGDGTHNHIDMIYLCNALNENLVPQNMEITNIGWFTVEQIEKLKTFENVKQTINKAIDFINKR
jgi:hypothetical protein